MEYNTECVMYTYVYIEHNEFNSFKKEQFVFYCFFVLVNSKTLLLVPNSSIIRKRVPITFKQK